MNCERGFLLFATDQERYLIQANRVARSLRDVGALHGIALITDQPRSVHADPKLFSIILRVPRTSGLKTRWGFALCKRIEAFKRSPFHQTVYLDSDVIVRSKRIDTLFSGLDEWDLMFSLAGGKHSECARLLRRRVPHCALLCFRKNSKTQTFFEIWRQTFKQQLRVARLLAISDAVLLTRERNVRKLLINDQTALASLYPRVCSRLDIKFRVLSDSWLAHGVTVRGIVSHTNEYKSTY